MYLYCVELNFQEKFLIRNSMSLVCIKQNQIWYSLASEYKSKIKSKLVNTNIVDLVMRYLIVSNDFSYFFHNLNLVPFPVRLVSGVSISNRFDHIFCKSSSYR